MAMLGWEMMDLKEEQRQLLTAVNWALQQEQLTLLGQEEGGPRRGGFAASKRPLAPCSNAGWRIGFGRSGLAMQGFFLAGFVFASYFESMLASCRLPQLAACRRQAGQLCWSVRTVLCCLRSRLPSLQRAALCSTPRVQRASVTWRQC